MKSHAPTSAERELARLAAAHYELPETDIPALIEFERHKNEQVKIIGMPGLRAIPCFIAGYNAARAAMQTAEPEATARNIGVVAAPGRAPSIAPAKDHVIREVVNKLRDVATEFHAAGQLRARIQDAIAPLLAAPSIDSAAGWISIADRLPEDAAIVAIFDPENTDMPVRTAQWLAGSCTFESEYGWLAKDEISHWQPLPPAPAIAALQPEGGGNG